MGHGKNVNSFQILVGDANEDQLRNRGYENLTYQKFLSVVKGKEKNLEFLVILKLLGFIDDIEIYSDHFLPVSNMLSSFFWIKRKDGTRMLVEVKNTHKDICKISNQHIEKIYNNCKHERHPLLFAVSLQNNWGLFTPEFIEERDGILELSDFYGESCSSLFDSELNTCSYMIEDRITIKTSYSKTVKEGLEDKNTEYGKLITFELLCNDKSLLYIDSKNSPYIAHLFILKALEDYLTHTEINSSSDKKNTTVVKTLNKGDYIVIPEYKIILTCVEYMLEEQYKEKFMLLNNSLKKRRVSCFCVNSIRAALSQIVSLGLNIIVFKGINGYTFNNYKENFWKKSETITQ